MCRMITLCTLSDRLRNSKTNIKRLDITAGFIINETAHKIARYDDQHNQSLVAKLFTVQTSFDWSFVVIWIIAMGTVVGGAYWSGMVQLSQYQPREPKPKKKSRRAAKSHRQASEVNANIANPLRVPVRHACAPRSPFATARPTGLWCTFPPDRDFTESLVELEEEFTVPLSPKLVIMFVIHMSVMLLVLYYFYRYLGETSRLPLGSLYAAQHLRT
ncbi:hypothetical protein MTO96_038653 [Rhipicephalus appendiculatus]